MRQKCSKMHTNYVFGIYSQVCYVYLFFIFLQMPQKNEIWTYTFEVWVFLVRLSCPCPSWHWLKIARYGEPGPGFGYRKITCCLIKNKCFCFIIVKKICTEAKRSCLCHSWRQNVSTSSASIASVIFNKCSFCLSFEIWTIVFLFCPSSHLSLLSLAQF